VSGSVTPAGIYLRNRWAAAETSVLGTTRRTDGSTQVTYKGRPLYFYRHEGRRQIFCQNVFSFGGRWLVVRPSGRLVR
jgi:predicted lipoprotein with Yx(FWY)xxD motif